MWMTSLGHELYTLYILGACMPGQQAAALKSFIKDAYTACHPHACMYKSAVSMSAAAR